MKIGFDITPIIYQRGVSRYTANLINALAQLNDVSVQAFGYSYRDYYKLQTLAKNLQLHHSNLKKIPQSLMAIFWRLNMLPIKTQLPAIDLYHSWDWLQPPDTNLPLVSTVHDLAILKYPQTAHPQIVKAHRRSWKILKERNAQIIAVSRATKKDLINLLGFAHYNVHIIPEALPQEFLQANVIDDENEVKQILINLGITRPYVLAIGTREPRKNIMRLYEAWLPLANDIDLVVAGLAGWDDSANLKHENLHFLGQVDDLVLNILYGEAELLCYPSLYEGFGLPILEAFHHGTPVVTANVASIAEVAGNAALLIDPLNPDDIRNGISTILNEDIQAQQKRLQRMIIRSQMFSWQKAALQTRDVYLQALKEFYEK